MSLISNAYAQSAAPSGGGMSQILILVMFVVVFYFLLIRPQQKRMKEQQNMLSKLAVGDEVVTTGGIVGRILEVTDPYLKVEIAENVRVLVLKSQVSQVVPKGTMKGA
jgi:preprotein translocase subunit YajC